MPLQKTLSNPSRQHMQRAIWAFGPLRACWRKCRSSRRWEWNLMWNKDKETRRIHLDYLACLAFPIHWRYFDFVNFGRRSIVIISICGTFFRSPLRPKDRYLQVNRVSWRSGAIFIMRTHVQNSYHGWVSIWWEHVVNCDLWQIERYCDLIGAKERVNAELRDSEE
jgi:hypothetical protein